MLKFRSRNIYFTILFFFFFHISVYPEKIVTTKEDLPDAYFGLKVGAVVSPSFGFKLRDSASGTTNAKTDDRTGFAMPWTLFMISKEWEEKNITVEFWGEILRNSSLTSDTKIDSGVKTNPYILSIRRASVKKNFEYGLFNTSLIFGIHELPHVYTQWQGYWKWRYVDKAPLESMGFSPHPADLGLSIITKVKDFSIHAGVVNGEGYREIQNTASSGLDAVGRFSYEPQLNEKIKTGVHLLGRKENFTGTSGNECFEGKTSCLADDKNVNTRLIKDLRSLSSETAALEFTLLYGENFNFGIGALWRRQLKGITYDRMNLGGTIKYEKDQYGKAGYLWIGVGNSGFQVIYRGEIGTGNNGILSAVYSEVSEPYNRFQEVTPGNTSGAPPALVNGNPSYSSNSKFMKQSLFFEYIYSETVRFSFGGTNIVNFESSGAKNKVYIDLYGDTRTEKEYLNQFNTGKNEGILQYSNRDRILFIKSTMEF